MYVHIYGYMFEEFECGIHKATVSSIHDMSEGLQNLAPDDIIFYKHIWSDYWCYPALKLHSTDLCRKFVLRLAAGVL